MIVKASTNLDSVSIGALVDLAASLTDEELTLFIQQQSPFYRNLIIRLTRDYLARDIPQNITASPDDLRRADHKAEAFLLTLKRDPSRFPNELSTIQRLFERGRIAFYKRIARSIRRNNNRLNLTKLRYFFRYLSRVSYQFACTLDIGFLFLREDGVREELLHAALSALVVGCDENEIQARFAAPESDEYAQQVRKGLLCLIHFNKPSQVLDAIRTTL